MVDVTLATGGNRHSTPENTIIDDIYCGTVVLTPPESAKKRKRDLADTVSDPKISVDWKP